MFTKHHERTCNNQKYKANNASLLKKVVFKPKLWDRWLHEEMELDLDKSIKKALGQFHDYFIECSTKLYYIV
uniref:Uncharacterized protein n=1 Tax=Helianthus annuus TaxID=4232 RepID=A0A251VCR3_HELAN